MSRGVGHLRLHGGDIGAMRWGSVVMTCRWLLFSVMLIIVVAGCGGEAGSPVPTESDSGDELSLDELVEEGDEALDELDSGSEFVELTATGVMEGDYSTFPRCDAREDERGEFLHVFFAFFDESKEEIPTIDVVMRIRPVDHEGDFEVSGDDIDVEYRHGDFTNEEVLDATVTGTVEHIETETGPPRALIDFAGTHQGEVGEGTFAGELSCIAYIG